MSGAWDAMLRAEEAARVTDDTARAAAEHAGDAHDAERHAASAE